MIMQIRDMLPDEQKYAYSQSQQLKMQTGSIGYLRGDFGSDGSGFYSTWFDLATTYKTDEFKDEFDRVVNALRNDPKYDFLHDYESMKSYCHLHSDSSFKRNAGTEYGFRLDTEKYAYLIRCNPNKGDYNFYVFPYVSQWLDKHIEKAKQGIRFINSDYKELFKIKDGDSIVINRYDGERVNRTCRFIDECHTEVGSELYHICQFAELMERNGNSYAPVEPDDRSGQTDPAEKERNGEIKMARYNAMTENFSSVNVLGKPALFTDIRIDRSTIPPGLHYYEIRHDDDGRGDFVQIGHSIMVNHLGSVIMRDKIKMPFDGYRDIEDDDIDFNTGIFGHQTVKGYMEKYPPKTKSEQIR